MLSNYTGDKQTNWSDYVNLCIFAFNTAVQKSIKISSHEAMFETKAKTIFSILAGKQDDGKSPSDYTIKIKQRLQHTYKNIKSNQDLVEQHESDNNSTKSSSSLDDIVGTTSTDDIFLIYILTSIWNKNKLLKKAKKKKLRMASNYRR